MSFIPYVLYDGLNILSEVDETVSYLLTPEQQVNQCLKIRGRRLLSDLFIIRFFAVGILSSSLRIWLDINNGLE